MEKRVVSLLISSCLVTNERAKLEVWVEKAKKTVNIDPIVATFQVVVVAFGERPSQSKIVCTDTVIENAGFAGSLLETHQITSIPCVVVVTQTAEGEAGEVLQILDETSESGTADEHCDAAIEAYNEFNIHEAVSR